MKMINYVTHVVLISCALLVFVLIGSDALRLKMIRTDKLMQENVTLEEKYTRFMHLALDRSAYLNSVAIRAAELKNVKNTKIGTNVIHPKVKAFPGSVHAVELGIGSQPYKTHLLIDTGSELTWVLSTGCKKCFEIRGGPFDPNASTSFVSMPSNDPLCNMGLRDEYYCTFNNKFSGGRSSAKGLMARDALQFETGSQEVQSIPNMVIGCAKDTNFNAGGNAGPHNSVSGVFALATGPYSFLELAKPYIGYKFSYCLPHWDSDHDGHVYLRFGLDVPLYPIGFESTPMLTNRFYINVSDISINEKYHLHIRPELFALREDGTGGFVVDAGSPVTVLVPGAYNTVEVALKTHLMVKFKMYPAAPDYAAAVGLNLCYNNLPLPNDFSFPSLTFHLLGADLHLDFFRLFKVFNDQFFCLMIKENEDINGTNLLGAYQMTDRRFTFNLQVKRLYFYPDTCDAEY